MKIAALTLICLVLLGFLGFGPVTVREHSPFLVESPDDFEEFFQALDQRASFPEIIQLVSSGQNQYYLSEPFCADIDSSVPVRIDFLEMQFFFTSRRSRLPGLSLLDLERWVTRAMLSVGDNQLAVELLRDASRPGRGGICTNDGRFFYEAGLLAKVSGFAPPVRITLLIIGKFSAEGMVFKVSAFGYDPAQGEPIRKFLNIE